ncbi:MAG TPA: hypothetical protein VF836_02605 [Gemmatimonadaceae bacterium]
MARIRGMWTGLVLGSALISSVAVAQGGSSVSLTHMVTVTVPPRVKVQVSNFAPAVQSTVIGSTVDSTTNGLSLSIRATQSWTLSIGSTAKTSQLQWSHDQALGYAKMGGRDSIVASGTNAQGATAATVFFRNAAAKGSSDRRSTEGSDAVMLTVAAQ